MNFFDLLIKFIKASNVESILVTSFWDLGWEMEHLEVTLSSPQGNFDLTIPKFENYVEMISDKFLESSFIKNIILENQISDYEYPKGQIILEILPDGKILFSFDENYITRKEENFNKEIHSPEFYDLLHQNEINGISATYDGYSDNGFIENFNPDLSQISSSDSDRIEEILYTFLDQFYPGWEINDGSTGEISIEQADTNSQIEVTIYHHWFLETSGYSIQKLDVTEEFLKYIDL